MRSARRAPLATGAFAAAGLGGIGRADGVTVASRLGVQARGVLAVALRCGAVTFVILKLRDLAVGLRVSLEAETAGLDLRNHGERAYML